MYRWVGLYKGHSSIVHVYGQLILSLWLQPGGMTQPQPGQTEPGIPYHVPSRWVQVGGAARRELTRGLGACGGGGLGEWLCCVVCFSCFLLICIVVVPVPSVCCSVKLPLCRPTSFCLLLAILLRTPAGGGAAVWRFCCWRQPNQHSMLVNLFGKRLNAHCPPAK